MTAMAAAVAASQAGAEAPTPAAQNYTFKTPDFRSELALIEDTRLRAIAICEENFHSRIAQLQRYVQEGQLIDRPALEAVIVELGGPEGGSNGRPDTDLMQTVGHMVIAEWAKCKGDAVEVAGDAIAAVQQAIDNNIAAVKLQTKAYLELDRILVAMENLANGDAAVLEEVTALRAEALRLSQLADARAASADANEAAAAALARDIEDVWARISSDSP